MLLQVLRDMNLPKLVDDDGLLFASLLHDLFATTVVDAIRQPRPSASVCLSPPCGLQHINKLFSILKDFL